MKRALLVYGFLALVIIAIFGLIISQVGSAQWQLLECAKQATLDSERLLISMVISLSVLHSGPHWSTGLAGYYVSGRSAWGSVWSTATQHFCRPEE